MASILVHLTHGPEAPTRAALAFLVAKSALDDGHSVSVFLAGDAVQLLRPPTLDAVQGIGTGSLREHVDAIVAGGGKLYASGMSSKARGLDADPPQLPPPDALGGLPIADEREPTNRACGAERRAAPRRASRSPSIVRPKRSRMTDRERAAGTPPPPTPAPTTSPASATPPSRELSPRYEASTSTGRVTAPCDAEPSGQQHPHATPPPHERLLRVLGPPGRSPRRIANAPRGTIAPPSSSRR